MQGVLFYVDFLQVETLFQGQQITLHVKNIPAIIILATEGLFSLFLNF